MKIKMIACGPISTNSYVLCHGSEAVLIDPAEFRPIHQFVQEQGLVPQAILLTHGHFDHMLALPELRKAYPSLPIYIHPEDKALLYDASQNGSMMFASACALSAEEGVEDYPASLAFSFGEIKIASYPGHTPGSILLELDKDLFTGDFIFKESIGRTDFSRGSPKDMQESLKRFVERYYAQADSIHLYPGHGDSTTLAHELQFNPFLDRITRHMGQ
jgi:hydroxyacylglutathione hydrolase